MRLLPIRTYRTRLRLRRAFRLHWQDVLVAVAAILVAFSALMRWPDKALADVAIPAALLIVFLASDR